MARQGVPAGKARMCSRRSKKKSVAYFAHDPAHRLLPAAADADGDVEFTCGGCLVAGAGRRYRCGHPGCGFTLHEVCALRSPRTLRSAVHPQHRLRRRRAGPTDACDVCGEDVKGACYGCAACAVAVHPLCARMPGSVRGAAAHPGGHEAWLVRSAAAEGGGGCAACGRPLLGGGGGAWRYRCATCGAELHPRCMVPAAEQCRAREEDGESVVTCCCGGLLHDLTRCMATLGTAQHYRGYYNG